MRCKAPKIKAGIVQIRDNEFKTVTKRTICNRDDSDRPMVFRGLPYCSENCRKALEKGERER